MEKVDISAVTLEAIKARANDFREGLARTPAVPHESNVIDRLLRGGQVYMKLECFQHTGTFKAVSE